MHLHTTHTHTPLDTKEKQAETGEQQTHWQKEMNSLYRDSHVYHFPPEGSCRHLGEDQTFDRSLTSHWLEESEQRLRGYDSTYKWDGGIPGETPRPQFRLLPEPHVHWHGPDSPAGGQKGPQVSAAAPCRTAQSGISGRPSHLPAKTKNELCFGLRFMFTTKMSLKKQH